MSKQAVTFGAHTDTTFVTLIPCSNIPGLEVFSPALDGWVRPEPACRPGRDIIILPGELLQVLSAGHYPAAVHRVVSVGGGTARVSAPLLVRPNPSAAVNAEAWLCPGGGNGDGEGRGEGAAPPPPPPPVAERLRALDGMNMRDLHQHLVDAFRDMEA
uniref:Fe2OG dioxygenase domain-containing protein n=1 Tax=Heterosigma akashiwo TaxID=2829 RepID=A0A7S4D4K1_HETAK|mmetsp:Transcript_10018/g.15758  ORF Transcript_10018/g.15758 Transcript_10018/m.15758 type:complete len:158 (-) Transcript_10018:375-848(-)